MRILMAMHGLPMGGAEKVFVRLANALSARHELLCYVPCLAASDTAMVGELKNVRTVSVPGFSRLGYSLFYKLTLMLRKPELEEAIHDRILRRLHKRHTFDVVNPHLIEATHQTCHAFASERLPIAESDHGYYYVIDPANPGRARLNLTRVDALICPSVANAKRAAELLEAARIVRQKAGKKLRLLFVGSGPCLDSIRLSLTAEDLTWIQLAGQQDQPEDWIAKCDVCLLPSYLPGESLPNSIIEYLGCGKPVLATPIGGIPEMLQTPDGLAGVLLPQQPNGRADVAALAETILQLMAEPETLKAMASRTGAAFARYSMDTCVRSYEAAFAELLAA